MITYFIINKLGSVIYQSSNNNTSEYNNESNRIRYLPLLIIKDLIKANLNDSIQYVKVKNKTIAFKEQQGLLYIACTKKQNIPVNLLLLHLKVIHQFIRFHYGPHWIINLEGNNTYKNKKHLLNKSDLYVCLYQLPFISSKVQSLRSCDTLCSSEQVQVSDDFRFRLIENLTYHCHSSFMYPSSYRHHLHRTSFFSSNTSGLNKPLKDHPPHHRHHSDNSSLNSMSSWSSCFLFAKEKLVAQCSNNYNKNEVSDEIIYFLKLLVSHYLKEKHESGVYHNNIITTTLPQNIYSSTSSPTKLSPSSTQHTVFPSSSKSETSTNYSPSSSLAYVYDANSGSVPFKMKEKTTSSVTVLSSDSSISYWTNNLPTAFRTDFQRTPSNLRQPHQTVQPSFIADLLNDDYSIPCLSSSVPSESTLYSRPADKLNSAPSSPVLSRSPSVSTSINDDLFLKNILTNLINGEAGYLDQTEDVKLVRRWIKQDGLYYLANFLLVLMDNDICTVVLFKDDPEKAINKTNKGMWKPSSSQVKQFKQSVKSYLSDFNGFLLTKESTHFTNLSFAVTYPGLIHFVHFSKGIMTAPSIVDLNDLDKHHELLHEVYGRYNHSLTEKRRWVWPSEHNLKHLCNQLLQLGLNHRQDASKSKAIEETSDQEYYFLYQKGPHHQELLAIYFSIIPPNRLWLMHQKLFNDINQRVL